MNVAKDQLKSAIQKIEALENEKTEITAEIKEIYDECRSSGLDTKIMKKVMKMRKMKLEDRIEEETLIELYMDALDMNVNRQRE